MGIHGGSSGLLCALPMGSSNAGLSLIHLYTFNELSQFAIVLIYSKI